MARKPRIEFEGAFYHVITRGNQRQKVFKDKEDYLKFSEILSRYKARYKYFLYAYVLMSNHVHLLIETRDVELSKILQGINQSYTIYFNRRHKTAGHLFQGRYKAILCDRDEYLLALVKYIHLNPVRARLTKTPDEYQWSSHHNYAKKTKEGVVDEDRVLRMFSEDKSKSRRLYNAYVADGSAVKKNHIYSTIDQRILGDERFADSVMERHEKVVVVGRRKKEYKLTAIAAGIEEAKGISLKAIRAKGKDRRISIGRKLLSLVASEYGYKGKEIAEYIQKDPALVTRHLKERQGLKLEIEKVVKTIKEKQANVNNQV